MAKTLIIAVIALVALGYGFLVSESYAEKPTLGDVLRGVIRSPAGLIAGLAIWFVAAL